MQSTYGATDTTRPSPIFFGLVALTLLGAWLSTTTLIDPGISVFIFVIAGWIVTLSLHEFAHALVAWRAGDHGVEQRGYLTLDPRKYTNPLLSIALPVFFLAIGGIGLPGGAVMIDRGRLSDTQAMKVALAGPFTNALAAVVSLALVGTGVVDFERWPALAAGLSFFGFLQAFVFVLNMLPIPGLDGYAAIEPTLPKSVQQLMRPIRNWGFLLLIMVLFYNPTASRAFSGAIFSIVEVFNLEQNPAAMVSIGYDLLRFWDDLF